MVDKSRIVFFVITMADESTTVITKSSSPSKDHGSGHATDTEAGMQLLSQYSLIPYRAAIASSLPLKKTNFDMAN